MRKSIKDFSFFVIAAAAAAFSAAGGVDMERKSKTVAT